MHNTINNADDLLQEARVARLAECHVKQKAGYVQDTSPNFPNATPILNILIQMKNKGLSEHSIKNVNKALSNLQQNSNLQNPEQIKAYIASKTTTNGYKHNLCLAYNKFCQHYQIKWEMPLYIPESKPIKIPATEKIEMLIANAGKTLATKLTISKECGLRPIEVCNLKVKDVDLEQKLIYPTTAKHGASRTLKMSNNLQKMLQEHIIRKNLNQNDKLFKGTSEDYAKHYRAQRNQLSKKLQDPTIRTIRLYDFRHYFATMTYNKTRDILFAEQQMGHKKIETTLIYTQLLNLNDDEWTCKAAKTASEATQLIEAGFQYVTTIEGIQLFKKRK